MKGGLLYILKRLRQERTGLINQLEKFRKCRPKRFRGLLFGGAVGIGLIGTYW